jgi:hypothetical protein
MLKIETLLDPSLHKILKKSHTTTQQSWLRGNLENSQVAAMKGNISNLPKVN